jgi:hypothetical protein
MGRLIELRAEGIKIVSGMENKQMDILRDVLLCVCYEFKDPFKDLLPTMFGIGQEQDFWSFAVNDLLWEPKFTLGSMDQVKLERLHSEIYRPSPSITKQNESPIKKRGKRKRAESLSENEKKLCTPAKNKCSPLDRPDSVQHLQTRCG